MVEGGDYHALDAPVRNHEVGADRVRVVVDTRDHPGGDVLDPAAVREPRVLRDRWDDPVERRETAEDRQHLVALRLLPEELAQLLDLLRMLAGEVSRLREVVWEVIELDGIGVGIPTGTEVPQRLGIE